MSVLPKTVSNVAMWWSSHRTRLDTGTEHRAKKKKILLIKKNACTKCEIYLGSSLTYSPRCRKTMASISIGNAHLMLFKWRKRNKTKPIFVACTQTQFSPLSHINFHCWLRQMNNHAIFHRHFLFACDLWFILSFGYKWQPTNVSLVFDFETASHRFNEIWFNFANLK